MHNSDTLLGATYLGDRRTQFHVWAPHAKRVEVMLASPEERLVSLEKRHRGYHAGIVENVRPGDAYYYVLDGSKKRPDPASRFQPQGVHGPSQVVDSGFAWEDNDWRGLSLGDYILYEIHIGTFTPEGTFDAAIRILDELQKIGVTAVELMPVAQFPGSRNWGYDGAYPYAAQDSYGGPQGLKRLVNACHRRGMAATLDVVYNHLGPEGNYLRDFGPYFTDRYKTPWGSALNFDGPESDEVRRFFIENALYWVTEFHFDALRLDAVHAIVDPSARPFLEELGVAVHARAEQLGREIYVVPESDRNDSRLVRAREKGGLGLDAQWSDDFHHALHTLLTGEKFGYYQDFGKLSQLAKAFREGYVYCGDYSAYRKRRHGNSSTELAAQQFVVFAQNHDQVGNRMRGERLSRLVSFNSLKLAAATVLLSPFVPLLFMGEEYGEEAPFPYFISHGDPALVEATRKGRREEFAAFNWQGEIPDPQDEATFLRAKLNRKLSAQGRHRALLEYHKELIHLHRALPALARRGRRDLEVAEWEEEKVLLLRRWNGDHQAIVILNFAERANDLMLPFPAGAWRKELDSEDKRWDGEGSEVADAVNSSGEVRLILPARSALLFTRAEEGRN
jgi:maltooligosyltrehalose trehalohydrolase